jgi:AcrR family transcriptional regulator
MGESVPRPAQAMSGRRRWVEQGDPKSDSAGDARRNEIIEATWRAIATIGLEKTTIRRIADDVKCTTGLVTHYFASKDDILLAALKKITVTGDIRMREAASGLAGLARLRSLVLSVLPLDEARVLEWRVWLAFWGRAYSTPRLRKEQQARYRAWRQSLQRAVEDAISLGELSSTTNVDDETTHLVGLIVGLSVNAVVSGNNREGDSAIAVLDGHLTRLAAMPEVST